MTPPSNVYASVTYTGSSLTIKGTNTGGYVTCFLLMSVNKS